MRQFKFSFYHIFALNDNTIFPRSINFAKTYHTKIKVQQEFDLSKNPLYFTVNYLKKHF